MVLALSQRKLWTMAVRVKRFLKDLDLGSWDNWLPLSVIALFMGLGLLVGLGVIRFPGPEDPENIPSIFIEVGIAGMAGIFAITVSLSLVAIQFASQEYSHRIMAFYVKSVVFWSTTVVFLGILMSSVLLLASYTEGQDPRFASEVVIGAVAALTLLLPHFVITAAFLRPEFIISKLLRRVDTAYLVSIQRTLEEGQGRLESHRDRVLPVVEIMERAINKGDLSTARTALDRLHSAYVTQAEHLNSLPIEEYFLDYVSRVGRKAISGGNMEEAGAQAIQLIGTVGSRGPAGATAVEDVRELGAAALKEDLEPVVREMIDTLKSIFDQTGLPEAKKGVLDSYRDLVEDLAAAEKQRLLRQLGNILSQIASEAIGRGEREVADRCQELLEGLGREAGTRRLPEVVLHTVRLLHRLGLEYAEKDADAAERIVRSLLRLERSATGDRELIAATEFAKGDVERELRKRPRPAPTTLSSQSIPPDGPPPPPPVRTPVPTAAPPPADPEAHQDPEFADLWSEPKD